MNKENTRTQKDLVTERKMQTDTLGNEQREQTDTNRLRDRSKDADRYPRQFGCLAYLSASFVLSLILFVSVCRLGPRGQERRTQADLETEGKLQADTLGNEQREQTDTNRLSRQNERCRQIREAMN